MALSPGTIVNTLAPIVGRIGAAGVAGNLEQESSDNPASAGGGLAQWQGERYTGLLKYAQARGLPATSPQAALGYLAQDLKGAYSGLASQLKAAKDPATAATLFSNIYERPGIPMLGNRITYAQQALGATGKAIGAAPAASQPTSPTTTSTTTTGLNQAAFDKANAKYIAGSFLEQSGSNPFGGTNPLIAPGLLTTKAPNPADYQTAQTTLQKVAGVKTPLIPHPAATKVPVVMGNLKGFQAAPGTNFSVNKTPQIASALAALGRKLGVTIVGISGYRTPAHSVAVGGFADDPHTKGLAADIGVNGDSRASAAQITNAQLAAVGLWRPFDMNGQDPAEVNHVQLIGTN